MTRCWYLPQEVRQLNINKLVAQSQAIAADRDIIVKMEKYDSEFVTDLVKASDGQYQERLNKLIQLITSVLIK
jgi:hypothetical protein